MVSDKLWTNTEDALTKTAGIPVHIMNWNWLTDRKYWPGTTIWSRHIGASN
jgi:hypothetical protein